MTVSMQAPSGVGSIVVAGGSSYVPNNAGQIQAANSDVATLLNLGFSAISGPGNYLANFRNLIDAGDFTVNPWQRNIAGLATAGVITTPVTNTVTYFADRFFAVGAAGSAILMAQVADTSVPGFGTSLKLSRQTANANTSVINFGQVIESADAIRAQGQLVTLSFYAKSGANYSGGALTALVYSGNGTNQSASSMVSSTWTGQATVVSGSQALTNGMTRYSFSGTMPIGATQLGVLFQWTPTGTAGADDSITLNGIQLEIGALSAFEHRDIQVELEMAQRYAWVLSEPAASVIVGSGMNTGASSQVFYLAAPVQFWKAPTVTVAAGTFKTNQAGTATATTISAGTTHTPNAISVNGNSTGTAGQATLLQGGGGSGYILASSDF